MAKLCIAKVRKKNVRPMMSLENIPSKTDVVKILKSRLKSQMLYKLISCFHNYEPIIPWVYNDCCLSIVSSSCYLWCFPILGTLVKHTVSLQSKKELLALLMLTIHVDGILDIFYMYFQCFVKHLVLWCSMLSCINIKNR